MNYAYFVFKSSQEKRIIEYNIIKKHNNLIYKNKSDKINRELWLFCSFCPAQLEIGIWIYLTPPYPTIHNYIFIIWLSITRDP